MKQKIAAILRSLGLIYFVDYLRYLAAASKASGKNKQFLAAHKDIAFPPPYMIYETFRLDYERYYTSGKLGAEWVRDEASPFKTLKDCDILDWGCGPGRVVRHLPTVIGNGCRYYGSDYNGAYVDWCSKNISGITFRKNELDPPLKFDARSFDVIYGISIFTHLSEEKHIAWFAELLRVLKPNGIMMITTHGDITRKNLIPEELAKYDAGKLVERAHVKEGHRMYTAYHPEVFMKSLIGDKATVLKHKPGKPQSWGLEQDLWIIQKS